MDAQTLFQRAPWVHLSGVDDHGAPLSRVVHGVVVDGRLAFHAADMGEKLGLIDRPVVASTHEVIAEIPSYFVDPRRACPATTYFWSAQVRGDLVRSEDLGFKTRVLQALMDRFQPEGGYVALDPDVPMYRSVIRKLLVASVDLAPATFRQKVGGNRSAAARSRILEHLWNRGAPGDMRAIRVLMEANLDTPIPTRFVGPRGTRLVPWITADEEVQVDQLLAPTYWNVGVLEATRRNAVRGATALVAARSEAGQVVAFARAVSDRAKHAWLYDVVVHPQWRGLGLGRCLVSRLLDHPGVRTATKVHLCTRDADGFYEGLGFAFEAELPGDHRRAYMCLSRGC